MDIDTTLKGFETMGHVSTNQCINACEKYSA